MRAARTRAWLKTKNPNFERSLPKLVLPIKRARPVRSWCVDGGARKPALWLLAMYLRASPSLRVSRSWRNRYFWTGTWGRKCLRQSYRTGAAARRTQNAPMKKQTTPVSRANGGKMIKSAVSAAAFIALFSTSAMAQTTRRFRSLKTRLQMHSIERTCTRCPKCSQRTPISCQTTGTSLQGRAAIKSFWENNVKTVKNLKLTTVNVQSLGGDAVLEIGRSVNSTNSQEVEGKYVILWHKTGANWKIAVDMFNRTRPR